MSYIDELLSQCYAFDDEHLKSLIKQAITIALEKQRKLTLSEYNQWEKTITFRTPQDVISDTKLEEL